MDFNLINIDNIKDFIPIKYSPKLKLESSNVKIEKSINIPKFFNENNNFNNNNYNLNIINKINNTKYNYNDINLILNKLYYSFNNINNNLNDKLDYYIYNKVKCEIKVNNFKQLEYLNNLFIINKINYYNNLYNVIIKPSILYQIILCNINNIVLLKYNINNLLHNNNLKKIIIDSLNNLKYIDINNTNIKYLTINNCNSLKIININNNQIKYLLINNCPNLEKIICSCNQIIDLNIINCNNIKYIDCSNNLLCSKSLKTIDLCKYKQLKYFNSLDNYILNINLNKETYNNRHKEFYYDNFTKINLCKLH